MSEWSWRYRLALVLAVGGLALALIYSFHPIFNDRSFLMNPTLAGQFGDFVGGFIGSLFSLAGVLLLFETLKRQQQVFQHQQFETRFFELLRLHRENVNEMTHRVPQEEDYTAKGRRVFIEMRKQYGEIYELVKSECGQVLSKEEILDVSYLILFYGVAIDSLQMIKTRFESSYPNRIGILNALIEKLRQIKAKNRDIVFFGGHQVRLGHYFRHLFHAVKYVDSQVFLTPLEKYEFVKTLRAQLSTHELAIFFFNSLSQLGAQWERAASNNNHKLITKYKLIKNIPQGFTFDIEPKHYYQFEYEYEERI